MTQRNQNDHSLETARKSKTKEDNSIFLHLMERVGNKGNYQFITFAIWCLLSIICGGLILVTPFIFFQDPYNCQSVQLPAGINCKDFVCGLSSSQREAFVPRPTIISLANKFGDYRCDSQMSVISLIESLIYAGVLLAIVLLALLGGMLGKKILLLANTILSLMGVAITSFSTSLVMGGVGMLFCNFGGMVNLNLCYIYIIETVHEKYRKSMAMILSVAYSVGALLNILWFYVLPNFKTVLICFYGIPAVLAIAFLVFFVKEAPIWLISRSSPQKAVKDLQFIAKLNRKQDFYMTVEEMVELQQGYKKKMAEGSHQKQKKFNVLDLFRYKSLRAMSFILAIIDITANLEYFTPSLMISQFNFSIYINGLVVQSAQLISGIISCFIINYVPRRTLAMVTFSIILVCSTVLIFVWDQNQKQVQSVGSNILVLVFIFVIQFAISSEFNCFVVYINELYPTQVRLISVGFIKTFGATILLVSSQIINGCLSSGFRIMILFAILAGLSIVCSFILPQTFGKIPPDIISELKQNQGNQEYIQFMEVASDNDKN